MPRQAKTQNRTPVEERKRVETYFRPEELKMLDFLTNERDLGRSDFLRQLVREEFTRALALIEKREELLNKQVAA